MTNQRMVTLFIGVIFLVSAYIFIDSGRQRSNSDFTGKAVEDLNKEIVESFVDEVPQVVRDEEVQELLKYENRDAARVLVEADTEKVDRLSSGAEKLLEEFSGCAASGSHCGVNTDGWEDYFGMGGPPLHMALLRALSVVEVTKSDIEKEDLFNLMKVANTQVSYLAASIALDRSLKPEEQREVLENSRVLKDKAKALFFEKYAQQAEVDDAFVEELSWAVNDKSDTYTRSEVLSRIEKLKLDEGQFRFVAFQACQGTPEGGEEDRRGHVVNLLHRKSKSMGMSFSKSQLCSLPAEGDED